MEDKRLYNKVMLIAFCIIIVLLAVGIAVWIQGKKAPDPADYVPRGSVQMLMAETEKRIF